MRRFVPALAVAAAFLCPAPSRAQAGFTFGGISWEGGIEAASQRLRAQGYRFTGTDSTSLNHVRWAFRRGGDSVVVVFAPGGLRTIWVVGDSLPQARAVQAYQARLAVLKARQGPGTAGVAASSWMWNAADGSWMLVYSDKGRLVETYDSPRARLIREQTFQPRVVRSNPQRGTGWYAGRVSAATWRPIHVADSLVASWDSAGATTSVARLVTARVRWDWRDVHLVAANPPYDAEEREVVVDCKLVQHDYRAIRYYNGREMVYEVPLGRSREIEWSKEPQGPEWDRVVRALCRLVQPGGG